MPRRLSAVRRFCSGRLDPRDKPEEGGIGVLRSTPQNVCPPYPGPMNMPTKVK
jgi:hypothetical protein